jgi:CRISPR/Cas system-associated exonuclease Cas4 (RecB family)
MKVAIDTAQGQEPIAAQLIRRRMSDVLEDRFDPRELRLSESGACHRKRVARALGLEGKELDETDAAYFERGNVIEAWVVALFREAFPRRCRTQAEVRTPTGEVGHIDLWFPQERRIIEVKSVSYGARELPRPEHIAQIQAYLHFFRDAQGERKARLAEIVYVRWGAQLEAEVYPVRYNPEHGRLIEAELETLHDHIRRGTLPDIPVGYKPEAYPCSWRNRAGVVKCSHWALCWANAATAPPLDAPEVADDVVRYAELEAKLRVVKAAADDLEAAIRAIRERLGTVLAAHAASELTAGGFLVRRTPVEGRTSYDIAAALKAGVVTEDLLAPFARQSAGYDRWTIKPDKGQKGVA